MQFTKIQISVFGCLMLLGTILACDPQTCSQPTDRTQVCAMKLNLFEFSTFSSVCEMEMFNRKHPESAYKIASREGVSCDDIDLPNVPHAKI